MIEDMTARNLEHHFAAQPHLEVQAVCGVFPEFSKVFEDLKSPRGRIMAE
jgi:hypothetical protein